MSLSTLLNIGSRAMTASYAALQTTGNNIANANTAGYSRQNVELATSFSQQTGSGFFGKGVDVTTVTRAHSDFLTRESATTQSLAAADAARSSQLSSLESVFKTGESGLGYAAQTMFNAFVDVANKPADASARQAALARVGDLASRFRSASDQIDSIQRGVSDGLRTAVTQINALTTKIADLNTRIANVTGTGHTPNDLLDQRDQAVSDLSGLVQVTTIASERRHGRRVHGHRPEARARRHRDRAHHRRRSLRPVEAADRGEGSARRPARSPTARSAAARSPACCASRTTTCPTRAR